MLQRKKFSITYPEVTPKYTNLFICVHDQLIVHAPSLDIDTKLGLIFPKSINIFLLAERFLHLPFKDASKAGDISIDFTNTTDKYGCVYTNRFDNAEGVFEHKANFIRMAPGERIVIPKGAIVVNKIPIRDNALFSRFVISKLELGATTGFEGPQGVRGPELSSKKKGSGVTVQHFYTVGSKKPKDVYDDIMKRNDEILDELSEMFKSESFEKLLKDNNNECTLEGKYFPQLNVISDIDKNIFVELNTSEVFSSSNYITFRASTLNSAVASVEKVRENFKKLKFSE